MYSISKTDGRQGTKGAKLNRYKQEFSQKQHNKTAVTYCKYPPNGLLSIIMENRMNAIAEVLEQELEGAFEVKDKKSLHRYIVLLTENIVKKENYENRQSEIKSDIKILAESLKQGFEHMDKRFKDMQHYMDKRFENMNKKFSMMFTFMNIGFSIIVLLTVLFKFIA